MSSKPLEGNCPDLRRSKEIDRLHNQHKLVKSAFGGLILCPVDLSSPNVRILDSATADGYFLYDLRSQLVHPNAAELIGTDIADYPDMLGLPKNITLYKQNIFEDWPEDWEGTFDFVHQRACMANAPTFDGGVKVMERLIKLLKPGGWIQIVDGAMPTDAIAESDAASLKIFKTIGAFLQGIRLNPKPGKQIFEMLGKGGVLEAIGRRNIAAKLGKGALSKDLENTGYKELEGLVEAVAPSLDEIPNPPMTTAEFRELLPLALEEARTKGVEMDWYAAWGQRT